MANDLHGDGPPADAHPGGDVAKRRTCPKCGESVKSLGNHLRYGCEGQEAEP